jgi:hypothetical protein
MLVEHNIELENFDADAEVRLLYIQSIGYI